MLRLSIAVGIFMASLTAFGSVSSDWKSCVRKEVKHVLSVTNYSDLELDEKVTWSMQGPGHYRYSFTGKIGNETYQGSLIVDGQKVHDYDPTTQENVFSYYCWLLTPSMVSEMNSAFEMVNSKKQIVHKLKGKIPFRFEPKF
jgi:hypothetical protein